MRNQSGFSLVEMVVAMTVTLIISSAIYGLLTAGGNAFRREPELADRQQNIRVALDLVTRDVYGAGAALPTFAQVFSRTDPAGACAADLNGCGQPGTMGPAAAGVRGGGGDSENTDVLEIVSTDEQCPQLGVCSTALADKIPGVAGQFVTQESRPACLNVPGLVVLTADNAFTIAAATASGVGTNCTTGGGAPNANFTLTGTLAPWVSAGFSPANPNPGSANAVYLYRARLVRYRVAPNPDPLDTGPALWRSEGGRYLRDGSAAALEPGEGGFDPSVAGNPWQLVARGVEDLQVEYFDGTGVWLNRPPISILNDWTTLVRQVRVTLSARAMAPNLQGQIPGGAGGPVAVRGQLSAIAMPRSASQELQICRGAALPLTPCPAANHIQ